MAEPTAIEQVQHIAGLARLELNAAEVEQIRGDLTRILEHIAVLDSVDTSGVEPTAHPLPLRNVMREDVAVESFDADTALRNAPQRVDDFFAVPKVLDQGDS